tara:strand:- start:3908 stop:4657 length:750 start_codon:yes stop_codon:yes gene_type:complete
MKKCFFSIFLITATLFLGCNQTNRNFNNKLLDHDISEDSIINIFIEPYTKQIIGSDLNVPLAYSSKKYTKKDGELNSTLSNLFADATFTVCNPIYNKISNENIDVVLLNIGGIRSIISKGNISKKTAFELMPFENQILLLKLRGDIIMEMVEYLIREKKSHPIYGLQIQLDQNYNLKNLNVNGNELDLNTFYNVATTDYLLKGGDNMNFFAKNSKTFDLKIKMRDVLIKYFQSIDTLILKTDKRFFKNE